MNPPLEPVSRSRVHLELLIFQYDSHSGEREERVRREKKERKRNVVFMTIPGAGNNYYFMVLNSNPRITIITGQCTNSIFHGRKKEMKEMKDEREENERKNN